MPSISNLHRIWAGRGRSEAAAAVAITADDLGAGVRGQPRDESVGRTVGKQIDHRRGVDVDQDGAVGPALAEGEVVHPQHQRTGRCVGRGRVGQSHQHAEQRHPADCHRKHRRHTGSGPPGQGQRDRHQQAVQWRGSPALADGQALGLFNEGTAQASRLIADEAANRQVNNDGPPGDGGIGKVPLVRLWTRCAAVPEPGQSTTRSSRVRAVTCTVPPSTNNRSTSTVFRC